MPRIALFPLRTVLLPGLVLPLHIFEPRYRLMIRMLADAPELERGFGVVAIRPGQDCEQRSSLYQVGTFARILKMDRLEDGRYDIVTVGASRFRIGAIHNELPYAQADVTLCDEPSGDPEALDRLSACAARLLASYRRTIADWGIIDAPAIDHLPNDPNSLSYLISAALVLDLPQRQAFLAASSAEERLAGLCALLRREIATMAVLPSMPAVDLAGEGSGRN